MTEIIKKRGPGGAQPGAGRPKGQGRYGEPTQAIRIPISMVEKVTELIPDPSIKS